MRAWLLLGVTQERKLPPGAAAGAAASLPNGPSRLSSRPSSGSTINPYAYSATLPNNQYSEPLAVYENEGSKRKSIRSSAIYDDVQSPDWPAGVKEPPYDNHISVGRFRKGEAAKINAKGSNQNEAPGHVGQRSEIEDLYSKPRPAKKKKPGKAQKPKEEQDSSNASTPVLQEGEALLVENELYHSRNQLTP